MTEARKSDSTAGAIAAVPLVDLQLWVVAEVVIGALLAWVNRRDERRIIC